MTAAGRHPKKKLLVIGWESSLSEMDLKLSTLSEHIGNLRQAIDSMGINSSPAVSTLNASYCDSADPKLWRRALVSGAARS